MTPISAPDATSRPPWTTVGQMPRRGITIPPTMKILELESVFLTDPLLTSVVLPGDEVVCITRPWFFHQLIGRLGYGRAVYARHAVTVLPPAHTLALWHTTSIVDATQVVLTRPEAHRYDDIVVRFDDGACSTFRVAELFAELAHTQAYAALHDGLTGLPNRRLFFDRLAVAHAQAAEDPGATLAVLFVDVDDFKAINDGLGHEAGDAALVETARRLSRLRAPGITVARLGGDEFGLLIDADRAEVVASAAATRIGTMMGRPMRLGERLVRVTASIGVAVGRAGASPDELMRNADVAMYAVKHRGKGDHAVYEGTMHTRARERLELHAAVEGVLER